MFLGKSWIFLRTRWMALGKERPKSDRSRQEIRHVRPRKRWVRHVSEEVWPLVHHVCLFCVGTFNLLFFLEREYYCPLPSRSVPVHPSFTWHMVCQQCCSHLGNIVHCRCQLVLFYSDLYLITYVSQITLEFFNDMVIIHISR